MKRIVVLVVALLCCFTTYSQGANRTGKIPTFIITPRSDVNHYAPIDDRFPVGLGFGNTSLYSLFEGSVGDNFSYSMSNHWLSTDPASLYQNAFRSDDVDFIDWLKLSYSVGDVTFTIGKDMLAIGGWELDPMDVDQYDDLCSAFWHNIPIYQWGGRVEYTTPSENSSVAFQFATSPFAEYPFAGKLFSYSLIWYGSFGCYEPIYSVNMMEYNRGHFLSIISLGNRFLFDDFTLEIDYMNRSASLDKFFDQEMSLVGKFSYNYRDKLNVFVKGGYEHCHRSDLFGWVSEDSTFVPTMLLPERDYAFYGAGVEYFPLRKSQDLRIHAVVAANNYADSVSLSLGVTYNFNLTETVLKHRKK